MALTKCNANVNNISALPDEPTTTATALKALMDKAGVEIKQYLNNVLIPEQDAVNILLSDVVKAQIDTLAGVDTTNTIQRQLNAKQKVVSGVDDSKIGYLSAVTSDIQGQLNGKQDVVARGGQYKNRLFERGNFRYSRATQRQSKLLWRGWTARKSAI